MSVDSVFSRLNPLVVGILRLPVLHWILSPGLMLITVTGRHSGRRYTIPVGYQRDAGGITVLVSEARSKSWWKNFREPRPVEIRLRGRTLRGRAHVLGCDSPELRSGAERVLRSVPGMGRVLGVDYDRRAGLTAAQLARLGIEIAAVRIEISVDP